MSGDLANTVSAVCSNAVSVSLLSVADGDDALRITVPGEVVDATAHNGVLSLSDSFANAIPHSHYTSSVATGNIESGW